MSRIWGFMETVWRGIRSAAYFYVYGNRESDDEFVARILAKIEADKERR